MRHVYDKYELIPQFLDRFELLHLISINFKLFFLKNCVDTNGSNTQLEAVLNIKVGFGNADLVSIFLTLRLNRFGFPII